MEIKPILVVHSDVEDRFYNLPVSMDGQPILPAKDDFVFFDGRKYIVKTIEWDLKTSGTYSMEDVKITVHAYPYRNDG